MARRIIVSRLLLLAAMLSLSSGARAEAGAAPDSHVRREPRLSGTGVLETKPGRAPAAGDHGALRDSRWYGWQTITADAAAMGIVVASHRGDSEAGFMIGAGIWVAGPGLLHLAHGRAGIAAASLSLRAGLPPLVFAATGMPDSCGAGCGPEIIVPVFAAFALPMLADAIFLSHESVPRSTRPAAIHLAPSFSVTKERSMATISAIF
jgi:hypothetical protein